MGASIKIIDAGIIKKEYRKVKGIKRQGNGWTLYNSPDLYLI
jgi:hypothetical protein